MTIDRDIDNEDISEKAEAEKMQSSYELQSRSTQLKGDIDKIKQMLVIFFFGPPVVVVEDVI